MFINKISSVQNRPVFKGIRYEINDVGEKTMRFYYPQGDNNCEIQFFRVNKNPNVYSGYEVDESEILYRTNLAKEGTVIDIEDEADFDMKDPFAYRVLINGKHYADTGIVIKGSNNNEYTLVTRTGPVPMVQGAGVFTMPDIERVGAYYDNKTGKVKYDIDKQRESESYNRTFANVFGGSLAGVQYTITKELEPKLKEGLRYVVLTPITGADNKSHHGYWNKNNMQTTRRICNEENYDTFVKEMYRQGKIIVQDGTFTSEGFEGIHFQHALRHPNSQFYHWFRMSGLKNAPIGLGVVPDKKEVLRHRVINPTHVYDPDKKAVVKNKNYDSNRETLFQVYDGTQVPDSEIARLDQPIENYEKIIKGNFLSINTHDDTLINYICQIDPEEYKKRLNLFVELNKTSENPIELNSAEGTLLVGQFSNFKVIDKTESTGSMTWDANTDMEKLRYDISNYDDEMNMSISDINERQLEKKSQERATFELKDYLKQTGRYWTLRAKIDQTVYTVGLLAGVDSVEDINKLIKEGKLSNLTQLSEAAYNNIVKPKPTYQLEPKGKYSRNEATMKALMELPLHALNLGENTVGVLATSYFSNYATSKRTLGKTRFELEQKGNPHLVKEYAVNYITTNRIYKNELKDFTDSVIENLNKKSTEKLLDNNGNYTEYGEYVLENFARVIARYALHKAIAGDKLEAWQYEVSEAESKKDSSVDEDGVITYNYDKLEKDTTLQALGVINSDAKTEATNLLNLLVKGLRKLNDKDTEFVASSIFKAIEGTDVYKFRLAEAMVHKSGLGLSWRVDALKDTGDQDAVRSRQESFDKVWQDVTAIMKLFTGAVDEVNPHSNILGEITDMADLMKASLGQSVDCYKNTIDVGQSYLNVDDAMIEYFSESGNTSEATYSNTFTDVHQVFGPDMANGGLKEGNRHSHFITEPLENVLRKRSGIYSRNMYSFADNHDKPSIIHGYSLDLGLLFSNMETNQTSRKKALEILTNSYFDKSMPIEARLNLNNPNYFGTVSPLAISMSVLLREVIDFNLDGVASNEEKYLLKEALKDFSNGNVKDELENADFQTIKIPELSSIEGALTEILTTADLLLSKEDFEAIVNNANDYDILKDHFVGYEIKKDDLDKFITKKEGANPDYSEYCLYTISLASLLYAAFEKAKSGDSYSIDKFRDACKKFITKYDEKTVNANRKELPIYEKAEITRKKNGYAAKDIEQVILELIDQAVYRASKDEKFKDKELFKDNIDKIYVNMYRAAVEPALQKSIMNVAYLAGLPGNATVYIRDMLCGSGFDQKTKNIDLQSRGVNKWLGLIEGSLKDFKQKVFNMFIEALEIRTRIGGGVISGGTAYMAKTTNSNIPAYLMQDGDNYVITLFNSLGINNQYYDSNDPTRRPFYNHIDINDDNPLETVNNSNPQVPRTEKIVVDEIILPEGVYLPAGLKFKNIFEEFDKATYITKTVENGLTKIVNIDGKGIYLNGSTCRKGVFSIKHIPMRGKKHINKQYNTVVNSYATKENSSQGEKLSILAK